LLFYSVSQLDNLLNYFEEFDLGTVSVSENCYGKDKSNGLIKSENSLFGLRGIIAK